MGIRTTAIAAALALLAAACGNDTCPTEAPQVNSLPSNCEALAGQAVNYPLQLCPTCNQTFTSCDVQISGSSIFLNPTVEACTSSSSCGAGCSVGTNTCTFTAPSAPASTTFTVSVFDPATNRTKSGTLTIVSSSPSCELAAL